MRRLATGVVAVLVGVGAVGGVASQASAQYTPPALLQAIRSSCVFCALQYDADVAGCGDDGSLDPEAETCRQWAYGELRRCWRTCWDDENAVELLLDLWQEDKLTSDQLVELLTD